MPRGRGVHPWRTYQPREGGTPVAPAPYASRRISRLDRSGGGSWLFGFQPIRPLASAEANGGGRLTGKTAGLTFRPTLAGAALRRRRTAGPSTLWADPVGGYRYGAGRQPARSALPSRLDPAPFCAVGTSTRGRPIIRIKHPDHWLGRRHGCRNPGGIAPGRIPAVPIGLGRPDRRHAPGGTHGRRLRRGMGHGARIHSGDRLTSKTCVPAAERTRTGTRAVQPTHNFGEFLIHTWSFVFTGRPDSTSYRPGQRTQSYRRLTVLLVRRRPLTTRRPASAPRWHSWASSWAPSWPS